MTQTILRNHPRPSARSAVSHWASGRISRLRFRYTSIVVESRVSLALGGGAAKGLAHVGVLRGLEEDGIEVAAIAGTSMGSIVGALYARGMSGTEMEVFFGSVDWARLGRIMLRSPGGAAFHDLLRETLGNEPIEDLGLQFAAVCCNLENGEEVILHSGGLADAVLASSSIPGILPPSMIDGQTLVDGAMVTPVPVASAEEMASVPVLAVNVLRPPSPPPAIKPVVKRLLEGAAPTQLLSRVEAFLDDYPFQIGRRKPDFPNRLEVVMRSFHIMQYNLAKQGKAASTIVEPEVGGIGWFEFERAREIMAEGYRAYRTEG
jgi:NTE family protein